MYYIIINIIIEAFWTKHKYELQLGKKKDYAIRFKMMDFKTVMQSTSMRLMSRLS